MCTTIYTYIHTHTHIHTYTPTCCAQLLDKVPTALSMALQLRRKVVRLSGELEAAEALYVSLRQQLLNIEAEVSSALAVSNSHTELVDSNSNSNSCNSNSSSTSNSVSPGRNYQGLVQEAHVTSVMVSALVTVHLSLRTCHCALVTVHLSLCTCHCALVTVHLLLCTCYLCNVLHCTCH
jgi:hypothetical protein